MGNSGSVPENYGFKIVEIISKSPGEKAGLVVEADFILTVNGKKLRKMTPEQIKDLVQSNEDREIKLKVFNSASGQIRDVTIVPSNKWPGQGLLGVRIRLEPYGDLNVEVSIAVRKIMILLSKMQNAQKILNFRTANFLGMIYTKKKIVVVGKRGKLGTHRPARTLRFHQTESRDCRR